MQTKLKKKSVPKDKHAESLLVRCIGIWRLMTCMSEQAATARLQAVTDALLKRAFGDVQ